MAKAGAEAKGLARRAEPSFARRSPSRGEAGPSEGPAPIVLITGCSSGIGLASARRFARAGFRVYASMRRPAEQGAALREEAAAAGWNLRTPALDVTSDE